MQLKPRKGTITTETPLIFFLLVIEIFDYLHKHANVFLHDCANTIWSLKGLKGFHLFTLGIFLCQKISITLQRMQASSIISRVIAVNLVIPQLPQTFQNTPPITMADLLQIVSF
jgi:hypothetical protein